MIINFCLQYLRKELENVKINKFSTKVIKNIDGEIYKDTDDIKDILAKHIINPVRFSKTIQNMLNYGEALKYHRETAKISQCELSRKIGTSHQNIGRWEKGEVLPNIEFCVKLADFYGISLDELIGRKF